jgi:hypothetical protein
MLQIESGRSHDILPTAPLLSMIATVEIHITKQNLSRQG